jgi:hypothetical protein
LRSVSDRFVVVLDANELFPFRVRDALLRFAEAGLFRARWSNDIIGEWRSSLLKLKPHLEESIDSQIAAMRKAFPESWVEGYEPLIDGLELPDESDRHVLAAAIRAGAEHIITENLKDFPANTLEPLGIEAVSADDFLSSTFELYPAEGVATLRAMRIDYKNPPFTPAEFIFDLQAKGMPKLASLLREHIDSI